MAPLPFRHKSRAAGERQSLEPEGSSPGQSLFAPRIAVALATIAAAALTAAGYIQLGVEPVALSVALPSVAGLGILVQLILLYAGRRLRKAHEILEREWRQRHRELEEIATRDDLTQLQNRRFFYQRLQEELARANKLKQPLSVLMIDVDDLKAVNDEFGHRVGDAALRSFSRILNEQAGPQTLAARLGGDEFAVIMPGADRRQADEMAWRLWETLPGFRFGRRTTPASTWVSRWAPAGTRGVVPV